MTPLKTVLLPLALLTAASFAHADEGQWQPYQMPQLKAELKRIGIAIPAERLADLSKHPMSAMVSTGICSASFVSPDGLIVTNHHCGYNAIQRNSTAANNLIKNGFLAKTRAQELPSGPNERIYVTEKVENVTQRVLGGLSDKLPGRERHEQVESRIKKLIAECEQDKAYRCTVPAFHRGMEYYRIRQLAIRDVRLVYAPAESIGNFGGDTDNFEWPRHTGDFSFLRAYVGKDGRPADPSPDNVPYKSKDFLVVSAEGLKNGDAILLAGYPNRTSRYKLPVEFRAARDTIFPARIANQKADIDLINSFRNANADQNVRYANIEKTLQNTLKRTEGFRDGFARNDIPGIKEKQEAAFRAWLAQQPNKPTNQAMLAELDRIIGEDIATEGQEFGWSVASNSDLLKAARTLYRLALEKQKPDAERESGYQERDVALIKARLTRLEQSFLPVVDQARWEAALKRYAQLPAAMHSAAIDPLLPDPAAVAALYQRTELADTAKRLAWMSKSADEIRKSADPFLQLAVRLQEPAMALENRRKDVDGNLERVVPQYMAALIAYKKSQGKPVYPDANSTLRVTYGTVAPYTPRDGIVKGPFTKVEGILEKYTGKGEFDAPPALLEAIKARRYGRYKDPVLGSVPVNFLSSADTSGGNSGSAIVNRRGELIGLNFDSTYESVAKDWYFDPVITRAIHVDIRYMLWVMEEVDHADNLLKEMTIKYPRR
jgi:hypothetical protein